MYSFGTILLTFLMVFTQIAATTSSPSYLGKFKTISVVASTVPSNGDVNPYGVAVISRTSGNLIHGNILVSNFNNKANAQGTGSTIVEIAPTGKVQLFAQIDASTLPGKCPGGVGLTTALTVLSSGWVIVGSLPTTDGKSATAQAGCLIVLNNKGVAVETITGKEVNGPWDMTAVESGTTATLFVANVLNGTVAASPNVVNKGTILRISLTIATGKMPSETSRKIIASGLPERTDPNALVIGPTGLGVDSTGTLYVADTLGNRVAAIANALTITKDAGKGKTVASGGAINGPLGLAIAPNGNILVANSNDGNLVEITPSGATAATKTLVPGSNGAGSLFGLAVVPGKKGVYFVNDGTNQLGLLSK